MSTELAEIPRTVDLDALKKAGEEVAAKPQVNPDVVHRFTPGLYTRQILMTAGTEIISKIHKTQHQYIVSQGCCWVSENGGPTVQLIAPYHGITQAGTWRKLFILMDCVWTTMHPTQKTTVEEVEAEIMASMEDVT